MRFSVQSAPIEGGLMTSTRVLFEGGIPSGARGVPLVSASDRLALGTLSSVGFGFLSPHTSRYSYIVRNIV